MPQVEGGNGQLYLAQPLAKVFSTAEELAKKAGDSFVTVERLLQALAMEKVGQDLRNPGQGRRHADSAQPGDQRPAQGPHRRFGLRRAGL